VNQTIVPAVYVAAELTFDELSDQELASVVMAVNWPDYDPRDLGCYAKVAHLFTERNGTEMRGEARAALEAIADSRF